MCSLPDTEIHPFVFGSIRLCSYARCAVIFTAYLSAHYKARSPTLDNLGTGRIYGNHVAIAATTVNNLAEGGSAPVIAARSDAHARTSGTI